MAGYVIVGADNIVSNYVEWDGVTDFSVVGTLVQTTIGTIGDKYENSKFYYWGVTNPTDPELDWVYDWIEIEGQS